MRHCNDPPPEAFKILPGKVWFSTLWANQNVPAHGKTA